MESSKPFDFTKTQLEIQGNSYSYFSLKALEDPRIEKLPFCIKVLLENAIRNCDDFSVTKEDVEKILDWQESSQKGVDIAFKPERVVMQDATAVPALVDLAAMRDIVKEKGRDVQIVNPLCPTDLVIDHSANTDFARSEEAFEKNQQREFERNHERFQFLKWAQKAFKNFQIVPPGSGIIHQVNLEYFAKVVFEKDGLLFPDTCIGTDSHTTMINGLGVVGWGVGGIEAESVMLGQPITMLLPQVVGFELTGKLPPQANATDLVLTVVSMLRKRGVVGKFVEFFGEGCRDLSLADRATVSNMGPEYGASMGFFAVDDQTIEYLRITGRSEEQIQSVEAYFKAQGLFYDESSPVPSYSGELMRLDLSTVKPCLAGPKRPQDNVLLEEMQRNFRETLTNQVGFKGYGLSQEEAQKKVSFEFQGEQFEVSHGSVVVASITSCTNTSNPDVIMQAGLLARNAVAKGLKVKPYIRTSISPGSVVVSKYLEMADLTKDLNNLGFYLAGYGCMTCGGLSGDLEKPLEEAITSGNLIAASVLSGNRNFEGRVHPLTRANYLASPALCIAYAIAGRVDIDWESEPIGNDFEGNPVFLKDIWPTRQQT